jgi:hypothetical protein
MKVTLRVIRRCIIVTQDWDVWFSRAIEARIEEAE